MKKFKIKSFFKSYWDIFLGLFCAILLIIIYNFFRADNSINSNQLIFQKRIWSQKKLPKFEIEIPNKKKYDILLQVTYDHTYPFYNLYLKYKIFDFNSKTMLDSNITEFEILNPTTGKPKTKAFIKNKIWLKILEKYEFPKIGKYYIELEHMMRPKELKGIKKLSLAVREIK